MSSANNEGKKEWDKKDKPSVNCVGVSHGR